MFSVTSGASWRGSTARTSPSRTSWRCRPHW
jgi:hypothetical protein